MDPIKDIDLAMTPVEEMDDESLVYWAKQYDFSLRAARTRVSHLEQFLGAYLAEMQRRGIVERILDADS